MSTCTSALTMDGAGGARGIGGPEGVGDGKRKSSLCSLPDELDGLLRLLERLLWLLERLLRELLDGDGEGLLERDQDLDLLRAIRFLARLDE